ncbi:MAG: UDP-N-acetylmuramoyl-tripeptide--D-alanyl-D-alanine ligase [Oscillospiraceae bacterium]|nr:UDP-N-acetylmuramoyl-tripeptide--D-alanyl-D-alanine ligase [Oscillospiraceae bacterium]
MKPMTIKEIAAALGKQLDDERVVNEISTDSRNVPENSVFVALKGEKFNGNKFAADALRNGALCVVVDEDIDCADGTVIKVESTRQALLDIAGYYRSKHNVKIAAVTGSVGKTTTKEFIWAVLNSHYNTLKTEGNQNNEVGLPKTLLRIDETVEAAVLEMGMCAPGEIHELAVPAAPDVGVVTSIGVSHMERLGSRENILKAKLEIIDGLREGAPLVLCADNDLLQNVKSDKVNIIFYGVKNNDAHVRAVNCRLVGDSTEFEIAYENEKYPVKIPCIGEHNVLNALAAFTVGVCMGITPDKAAAALADYQTSGMRQKIVKHNNYTVVEDCYNASPDSMKAAVSAFSAMSCKGRRIMVLADMLELGANEVEMHYEIGRLAAQNPIHILLAVGKLGREYVNGAMAAGLNEAFHFENKDEAFNFLKANVQAEDILWFKASRGMKLEDIITRLYEEC